MRDSAPCHHSKLVSDFLKNINMLDWPGVMIWGALFSDGTTGLLRFVVPTKCKTALVGTALCITHAV